MFYFKYFMKILYIFTFLNFLFINADGLIPKELILPKYKQGGSDLFPNITPPYGRFSPTPPYE